MRYAGFLRAINAGNGHYVKMDVLRNILTAVPGLENVATYSASGNLVFDVPAQTDPADLELEIEIRLLAALGYPVPAFLRAGPELRELAALRPFGAPGQAGEAQLNVIFLRDALPADAAETLLATQNEFHRLALHGRHVFWLRFPPFRSLPGAPGKFEKIIGAEATMRGISTVRAVLARFFEDSEITRTG